MGVNERDKRVYEVLVAVTTIPKNIITLHGIDNMTEFLLHTLSQQDCFNFSKAAYFVDNPDFDHFKGIAGFAQVDSYRPRATHWSEPDEFSQHMRQAPFNNQVRNVCRCSIKRNKQSEEKVIQELSDALRFSNPRYVAWPVKHDNIGLLVFEKADREDEVEQHLESALSLFGFCPIF